MIGNFQEFGKFNLAMGAQWLSGRVLDSRPKGRGFKPHRGHCVVVFEQDTFILASLVLVQPRKTHPCLIERLLIGRKESNQTKQSIYIACTMVLGCQFARLGT